jgi:hypothetical protein
MTGGRIPGEVGSANLRSWTSRDRLGLALARSETPVSASDSSQPVACSWLGAGASLASRASSA